MRGKKKDQVMHEKRKALEQTRSAESKARKEKRKEKGKAEEIVKAIKRSPAGKKAAETLKEKRGLARKQEQANYQKTRARAATRLGGRKKQTQAELHGKIEE
jgi:hypothetical protein